MSNLNTLMEYIKNQISTLEKDLQNFDSEDDIGYLQTEAALSSANLILSAVIDLTQEKF